MTIRAFRLVSFACALALAGCARESPPPSPPAAPQPPAPDTFQADVELLRAHTPVIVLAGADAKAQVAIAPGYQARVMTSSAGGADSTGFGYLHRPGIVAGTRQPHMTVLGGEDRFWLGPEGGQYALYFSPGAAFDPEHWQVPEPIDWGGWPVTSQTAREVAFQQTISVTNRASTKFTMRIDRTIRLLERDAIAKSLGLAPGPGTSVVAYESDNRITNLDQKPWTKSGGLISIWILGMYRPGAKTTVVVPFVSGSEAELGPIVNDVYFGRIAADRLKVGETAVFFRGDGKSRGKIGLSKRRTRDVAGSYDPDTGALTIVKFTLPAGDSPYVNSVWAQQSNPYAGDVVNSYNDGPMTPGAAPLGPFYELESSSPAAALAPGATLTHIHRTIHLRGPASELDILARKVLGVSLDQITGALR